MNQHKGIVLVVDDDYYARQGLETLLKLNGFDVLVASGGMEAFRLARDREVDVAVVDVNMPEWDGFQVAAKLRQLTPACRIILFTSQPNTEGDSRALDQGLYEYLPKSTWYTALVPAVEKAMASQPPSRAAARSSDPEELAAAYEEEGKHELAALAHEKVARELEFSSDFQNAAVSYEKAEEAYAKAKGIASLGAERYRLLAEKCRELATW